jgi:hypothetical protein
MNPVRKTVSHSVYDGESNPCEFAEWFAVKWASLSDSEKLSAKMHIGRGSAVTFVGFTYTEGLVSRPHQGSAE